jgi:hypothetical protein
MVVGPNAVIGPRTVASITAELGNKEDHRALLVKFGNTSITGFAMFRPQGFFRLNNV